MDKLWPEAAASLQFDVYPIAGGSLGDLTSDLALRLAKIQNRDPRQLVSPIIDQLAAVGWEASSSNNYVNVKLSLSDLNKESLEFSPACEVSSVTVVAPACNRHCGSWGSLRLATLAYMQACFLKSRGVGVELLIGSHRLADVGFGSYADLVKLVFDSGLNEPSDDLLDGVIERSQKQPLFVWLASRSVPQSSFERFCSRTASQLHKPQVRVVEAQWLDEPTFAPPISEVATWKDTELAALSFHLCSACVARDLDPYAAQLSERANLRWYIAATAERLRSIYFEESGERTCTSLSDSQRELWAILVSMSLFYSRAASRMQMPEFFTVLMRALEVFNGIFNQPEFRLRLSEGTLSQGELSIIAGTKKFLSSLVELLLNTSIEQLALELRQR
ncbi:MAG: hypothetical protein KDD42_00450 [Bdellovibrionales bacterium]|nr:hypothetical protein [Bdellovibrionales bacterium]